MTFTPTSVLLLAQVVVSHDTIVDLSNGGTRGLIIGLVLAVVALCGALGYVARQYMASAQARVDLQAAHAVTVATMSSEHAKALRDLADKHASELKGLNSEHTRAIREVTEKHASELKAVQDTALTATRSMTERMTENVTALTNAAGALRAVLDAAYTTAQLLEYALDQHTPDPPTRRKKP